MYLEATPIRDATLTHALTKMLGTAVVRADYQTEQLHGGTLGDVRLLTGTAETSDGQALPYRIVLKIQRKWERQGDPDSWRREYDLYASELGDLFTDAFRWPTCYHAELTDDQTQIWMEHIDGTSGLALTGEMYERAARELGRFQGRLYAEQPRVLKALTNLSGVGFVKNFYLHYRSWDEVYAYIRSESCELPEHLRQMLIDVDEHADEIFSRIETLPVVLCHRDFWVANIFSTDGSIRLIDWDTTGWGYLGEDIASLLADEADAEHLLEYYPRCTAAYFDGFSEHASLPPIPKHCVCELILLMFGYRLVEWYKFANSPDDKALHLKTLERIYEIQQCG